MNDQPHTGAEELIQADIKATGLSSAAADKEVHEALDPAPGVEQVRVEPEGKSVVVLYDPVQVTKKEISEKLAKAGHPAEEVKIERDSIMEK
jgi:copper chaperone CopZ